VRGDYEGIYEFLDTHEAKECGDSIATLRYDYKSDLLAELKKDLSRSVKVDRKSRVYVIYPDDKGSYKGRFLMEDGRVRRGPDMENQRCRRKIPVSKTALVDTGFWIAFFDPRDQHHAHADTLAMSLNRRRWLFLGQFCMRPYVLDSRVVVNGCSALIGV